MAIDKIICVGKNYLDHALELGDPVPEKPVIFMKPASVLKQAMHWGEQITAYYPDGEESVQPECEIAFSLAQDGFKMNRKEAERSIKAVTLGLDMTLRARQSQLKKLGHPWTTAKIFVDAAILGPWIPCPSFKHFMDCEFQLALDDKVYQRAKGQDMMMEPIDLLVYISQFFPLKAGDIVFTGTPAGVTSISKGTIAKLQWDTYDYLVKWI
ncbi:MAG: fumarylacetoacetate hydrolase family protein [Legionellaceae bacterium]|nr:fumarylacetoacetate hydrolase family protein [Legionellaceae bacterium]